MAKIERSTDGLRIALFEELDKLRSGTTTPQKASALARLAAGVVAATKLDLEYQRFAKSTVEDDDAKHGSGTIAHVPPLSLLKKAA